MTKLIKGRVVVIKKPEDYYNIEKSDTVLVVRNTHPELTLVINKIKAIVSEIDNKLCHAAIIAREFNKPILMGVNKATKKFKSGDKVMIDFDNRLIRKIK